MADFPTEEYIEVLVEFPPAPGRHKVARKPEDAAEESAKALDKSMRTIQSMAHRFTTAMNSLDNLRPSEMELEFGIKFDVEVGAIITKTGLEANLNVKLLWKDGDVKGMTHGA